MKKNIRKLIAALIWLIGTILIIYLAGYWMLFQPIRDLYQCYINNHWTLRKLFIDLIRIFFASTAAGGLWCIFDILAGFFRDDGSDKES